MSFNEKEDAQEPLVSFPDGDRATVRFSYKKVQTVEEEDALKKYYQWRFSQEAGRPVPIDEIEVDPKAGEEYEVQKFFVIKPGEPFYIGLITDGEKDALPKLVDDLNQYVEENELDEIQLGLVREAIAGIQEIVDPTITDQQ